MQTNEWINANEFCVHHNIEISFIQSLKDAGLVEIFSIEETWYIGESQLHHLEKLIHFYELGINLEGIETINHLLERMSNMEMEINRLKNRLSFFD